MKNSEEPYLLTIIINLILAYFERLNDLAHLAGLEARLAIKTFISITFLFFILFILLISIWLSILTILFIYLISLHYTLLFSASIIMFINILLFTAIGITITKLKIKLFFPATRRYFYSENNRDKEVKLEQTPTTNQAAGT